MEWGAGPLEANDLAVHLTGFIATLEVCGGQTSPVAVDLLDLDVWGVQTSHCLGWPAWAWVRRQCGCARGIEYAAECKAKDRARSGRIQQEHQRTLYHCGATMLPKLGT